MALKLNPEREACREFCGKNVEQMPLLMADGRVPMNADDLMQRTLNVRNGHADVKAAWTDNYFDIGDGIAYHPDGKVKIVLASQTLREMTLDSPRNGGALILGEGVYEKLDGEEFEKGKLGKINEGLTREEVKVHPVWRLLARGIQALLNDYTDLRFAEGKEKFGYDTAMGIYPGSCGGKAPEMMAWCVRRLGSGSGAYGRNNLDDGDGRLVGLAPEAQSAPGKGASAVQRYTMADVQTAKKQLDALAQVVRAENLKDVKTLVAKL